MRVVRAVVVFLVVSVGVLLLSTEHAMACSCVPPPPTPPAVEFEGIARDLGYNGGTPTASLAHRWSFEVVDGVRGVERGEVVTIEMSVGVVRYDKGVSGHDTCGMDDNLVPGERYHVIDRTEGYAMSSCSGSVDGPRGDVPVVAGAGSYATMPTLPFPEVEDPPVEAPRLKTADDGGIDPLGTSIVGVGVLLAIGAVLFGNRPRLER